jgi:hypothetical protein
MARKPFDVTPEFITAYKHIVEKGFFEGIKFNVQAFEGVVLSCTIEADGRLPNEATYMAAGCGAVIEPLSIIASCKALGKGKKVRNVIATAETSVWPLYDEEENSFIGSKGTKTTLYFHVSFDLSPPKESGP